MSSLAAVDIIEALVFASEEPLTMQQIVDVLQIPPHEAQEHLQTLKVQKETSGGLALIAVAGGYRLVTKPAYADYVAKLREPKPTRLSRAALEVLSIVAYRQPLTHAEVDQIRGVDSSHSLKTLMERGLIYSPGRKEAPGRPHLYATTEDFLDYLGIASLEDLPKLQEGDLESSPLDLFQRPGQREVGREPPSDTAETAD